MRITIPSAGQYGVVTDLTPAEMPFNAWSLASNIRFRDGYAERFEGQISVFTAPSVTPYHLAPYGTSTGRYWIHSGLAKNYADDGTTRTEITPLAAPTGAIDDRYTGGTLNGVFILNNGIDKPWYWGGDTGTDLTYLTAWPANTRVSSLRPWSNYLVGLNVLLNKGTTNDARPHMVKWSNGAEPGTIPTSYDEADPTNDAGQRDLAETPGTMVDSLPMGNVNVIYKQDAMYAQSYIGGQEIFAFQRLPGDFGLLARGCAAATPKGHLVLCPGDVILHNGQGPESILTGKVRRALFAGMDSTYYARSFVVSNPPRNEVWICYPETGQTTCTAALVWNWTNGALTFRSLPVTTYGNVGAISATGNDTWDADTGTWDSDGSVWGETAVPTAERRLVLCQSTPKISLVDSGTDFNGTTFTATLERTDLVLQGDTYRVKHLTRLVPRFDAAAGTVIYIQAGGRNTVEEVVNWKTASPYTVGTSRKADLRASYVFPAIRFYSTAAASWRLGSYDLEYELGGDR